MLIEFLIELKNEEFVIITLLNDILYAYKDKEEIGDFKLIKEIEISDSLVKKVVEFLKCKEEFKDIIKSNLD